LKFVLGHCDLLSANIILSPEAETDNDRVSSVHATKKKVQFIDYEYAVPCPPAFDLANHFSEWGGFECEYNMLPTRATRRAFIEEYLRSFALHKGMGPATEAEVDDLLAEVDRFRGIPGFYWGVQSFIQATISGVQFDWVHYAETRLSEFYAWREEEDGSRAGAGREMPLRERRWAQEAE
jgi:ethanolamine kinase